MKRRDFIKTTAAAGAGVMAGFPGTSQARGKSASKETHELLHPFIREHPEAVFIKLTDVQTKTDAKDIHDTAFGLAKELFVAPPKGVEKRITCKPNWTANPLVDGKACVDQLGINTDKNFIEGFMHGIQETGTEKIILHECANPELWEFHGWPEMARKNGFVFRDLSSKDFWELKEGTDLKFVKVPGGVVFKKIAMQVPIGEPDTYLVNIAKLKAHGMGITAAVKNLQGISGKKFHQFCGGSQSIFREGGGYDKRYHPYFHKNYLKDVQKLREKHVKAGIPRWDKPDENGYGGGFWMEQWVQRMLDSLSVTRTGLNMVEGIYGRDGGGFDAGPHEGKARDYMVNQVIFGLDIFRVDIISHWLAGHEPGNFGLFHIGIERGMSNVLDPHDIPVYLWDEGKATLTELDTFTRTPLVTYYLARNYGGQNEPLYHLCDEPFDYSAWKAGKKMSRRPDIRPLGRDSRGNVIMDLSLPEKDDVWMDILDSNGQVVWRLKADGLEPGVHQVVWDGFSQPGLYTSYVRGMGWDAARKMVVYS